MIINRRNYWALMSELIRNTIFFFSSVQSFGCEEATLDALSEWSDNEYEVTKEKKKKKKTYKGVKYFLIELTIQEKHSKTQLKRVNAGLQIIVLSSPFAAAS